jgi:hypothetical protein
MFRINYKDLLALLIVLFCTHVKAHETGHEHKNTAHYLGNEAVLIVSGKNKVLFDPFFHKDFGFYQRVPKPLRQKVFNGQPPYDNVSLIVISHAHEDHFSAIDVLRYLTLYSNVELVAPKQAIDQLLQLDDASSVEERLHSIELAFGDAPVSLIVQNMQIEAVRIPHAGWPGRAEVENLVYRVSLRDSGTVMHLGDADAQLEHYRPYATHWDKKPTELGFPPYWFLQGAEGRYILKDTLNIKRPIGVHVPMRVPELLIQSGEDYFSKPSETRTF